MRKQQKEFPPENLESLEAHLAKILKPVAPRRDFVQRLRSRVHLPERAEIVSRLTDWKRLFLAFGSAMSGMLLLITLARALYYLFGRRKVA